MFSPVRATSMPGTQIGYRSAGQLIVATAAVVAAAFD
jgi:hypothetical protein